MTFSYVTQREKLAEELEAIKTTPFVYLDIETTAQEDFTKSKIRLVQLGDDKTTML
jgi:ribonuclease D